MLFLLACHIGMLHILLLIDNMNNWSVPCATDDYISDKESLCELPFVSISEKNILEAMHVDKITLSWAY